MKFRTEGPCRVLRFVGYHPARNNIMRINFINRNPDFPPDLIFPALLYSQWIEVGHQQSSIDFFQEFKD